MERSQLKAALPYAVAFATGGIFFWAILHYYKGLSNKLKRHSRSKYRYPERSLEELEEAEWEFVGEVYKLWIYPVKSCAPVPITHASAERTGFKLSQIRDRSLMIIDKNGNMVTGRKVTSTLLITPVFNEGSNSITLLHPHLQPLQIDLAYFEIDCRMVKCRLWEEEVSGIDCGDEAADWLKLALNKPYRLVYHGSNGPSHSITTERFPMIKNSDSGLYSDLAGYMLMTTSSLDDLQKRASCQISYENFRPGILVKGTKVPYDEDNWTYIKIGETYFRNVKPCTRCILTTTDFKTGKRDPNMEPLKTLRKYRCHEGNKDPYLGINLGLDKSGAIAVNDKVYVLRN